MEPFVDGRLLQVPEEWSHVLGLIQDSAVRQDMAKLQFLKDGISGFTLVISYKQIRIQEYLARYVVLHSANVVE